VRVRFTCDEHRRIRDLAAGAGTRPASWIGELVTAALSETPRPGLDSAAMRDLLVLRAVLVDVAGRVSAPEAETAKGEVLAVCGRVDEAAGALLAELRRPSR